MFLHHIPALLHVSDANIKSIIFHELDLNASVAESDSLRFSIHTNSLKEKPSNYFIDKDR